MADLINETDSAMFYLQDAWHGKGEIFKDRIITKPDLIEKFGYPIAKEQLFTAHGEPTTTYATIREYNGKRIILGDKLSAQYSVLQNSELIDCIDPLLEAGCIPESALTLKDGQEIVLLLRLPGDLLVGNGEHIKRFIMLSNEHTGMKSARVGFVPIRVVCANTLSMAEGSNQSSLIRVRHKGNVGHNVELVTDLIDTANGQFLAYGKQLEQLMTHQIVQADLDKYVKRIFFPRMQALSDNATSEDKEVARKEADRLLKLQNAINEIFQTESSIVDQPNANGTVYGAYQAVNYYLNHVQAVGEDRRLKSVLVGPNRQIDLKALELAKQLVTT
jgi:phage/plasmid-like protein (TIGR03299 family)